MKTRVLVIEDNADDALLYRRVLEKEGYAVEVATNGQEGRRFLFPRQPDRGPDFDVVLTDLNLGRTWDEGRELIAEVHSAKPHLPVILMTGSHTADIAIDVIKIGAFDYFSKPANPFEESFRANLAEMIDQAATGKRLMARVPLPGETSVEGESTEDRIIGNSRVMQNVYKEIGRVAAKPVTVLIRGETGTGKELAARAIYTHSDRARQPFIIVNCAAIPENLLESELFGHESGAFTGARARRIGRFELAHRGTIFLDEIGDMNLNLQQKLLRVLQEKTIERVGGREPIAVDVRVLAATHRDLEFAIQENAFRQDLYFRLNVAVVRLPPLRERKEDLPALIRYFINRYGPELGSPPSPATKEVEEKFQEAIVCLQEQSWPGNIRELRNVVRKALLLARGYPITAEIVRRALEQMRPPSLTEDQTFAGFVSKILAGAKAGERDNVLAELSEVVERELYRQTISRTDGDQSKAARWLGVSRPTMLEKLRKFDLHPARGQ